MALNTRCVEVNVYSTRAEAEQRLIVEPIQAGLDPGEDATELFDVEAIANQVIEWHTELRWRNGRWQEWLPAAGFCSALGDDPAEFWEVVAANRIEANDQGHPSGTSARVTDRTLTE